MNSKIQVVRNPNKRTREVFTFTMCASISGIAMSLDTYSKYRKDDEGEFVAIQSFTRAVSVAANSGPRFSGMRSREQILERKSIPADVEQDAKLQLMERIEFIS